MKAGLASNTEVLLNPRLAPTEKQKLQSLAGQYALAEHVWIASSGSTQSVKDSVKLIALSHRAILASAKAVNAHLESESKDCWAQVLPRFHVGGLGVEVRASLTGSRVVPALRSAGGDDNSVWDANYFVSVCENQKVTLGSLVPTQVFDIVSLGLKSPAGVRAIVVGGGALSFELYKKARELGWPLLPSFGMTEVCSQAATATLSSLKSPELPQLKLMSHLEARLTNENCVALKGLSLLTGFAQIRNGEYVWIDPKDRDGWLATEDLAELSGGWIKPLGRRGEYLKISGEGVSLLQLQQKLEVILLAKGFAASSAVIASRPDARRGAELILVCESSVPEKSQEDLRTEFNQVVQPYEKVHRIEEIEAIPRTELGKLKRNDLLHKLRFN